MITKKEAEAAIKRDICLYHLNEFDSTQVLTPDSVTDDGKCVVDWCGCQYRLDEVYLTRASAELAEIRKQRDELIDEAIEAAKRARIAERNMRARMRGE
jgi:hypothetical protein